MSDAGSEHEVDAPADREAVYRLAHDVLREDIRLAVRGVVSGRFRDERVREALTAELLRAIDRVVDDHIATESLGTALSPDRSSEAPPSSTGPADGTVAALKEKLQALMEGARPGIQGGATTAMRAVPVIASSLARFVHDDVAFGQAQRAAELVLGRYMSPIIARQVVSVAAGIVRRGAGAGEEKGTHPGDRPF